MLFHTAKTLAMYKHCIIHSTELGVWVNGSSVSDFKMFFFCFILKETCHMNCLYLTSDTYKLQASSCFHNVDVYSKDMGSNSRMSLLK